MIELKDELMSFGGKLWQRDGVERIYLNRNTCIAFLNIKTISTREQRALTEASTYYDLKTNQFYSNNVVVRSLFREFKRECREG